MSDAEQRAQRKKRARRDFDDEDYEEPAQPRRVSARRQVSCSLDDPTLHDMRQAGYGLYCMFGLETELCQRDSQCASII